MAGILHYFNFPNKRNNFVRDIDFYSATNKREGN